MTYDTFHDADGNFVEQFQTHGFDARVFELYLQAYFETLDGHVERPARPDFLVTCGGVTVAVEATTSNPPQARGTSQLGALPAVAVMDAHYAAAQQFANADP